MGALAARHDRRCRVDRLRAGRADPRQRGFRRLRPSRGDDGCLRAGAQPWPAKFRRRRCAGAPVAARRCRGPAQHRDADRPRGATVRIHEQRRRAGPADAGRAAARQPTRITTRPHTDNELFRKYLNLRVAIGQLDLTKLEQRHDYNKKIANLQNELWSLAISATNVDPRPVTTGAFVKSLNDVIDSQGRRNALLQMHVPEVVLLLLFVVFISSGGIMGYSAGLSGKRITAPIILVSLLITLIVFIIIDLDRPKRGLIQVNQDAMTELLDSVNN